MVCLIIVLSSHASIFAKKLKLLQNHYGWAILDQQVPLDQKAKILKCIENKEIQFLIASPEFLVSESYLKLNNVSILIF